MFIGAAISSVPSQLTECIAQPQLIERIESAAFGEKAELLLSQTLPSPCSWSTHHNNCNYG